jgi:hypothetical protein
MPAASQMADPLLIVRWADVLVVILATPFALLMGAPALGYLVGGGAWILSRVAGAAMERHARARADARAAIGLNFAALIARSWLVGLTILAVGLAGEREDGLTAAILMAVAFTLYFAISLFLRPLEGKTKRT